MSDDRESLGRLVHETRLAHEAERAAAEGRATFLLGAWEDRTDHQRELDMRIADAVAVRAVADAGIDRAALEMCRAKLAAVERACARTAEAVRRQTGIPVTERDIRVDGRIILNIIRSEEKRDG
jgi:hypothetical protein